MKRTRNCSFQVNNGGNKLRLNKCYAIKFIKTTGIEIQNKNWSENRSVCKSGH